MGAVRMADSLRPEPRREHHQRTDRAARERLVRAGEARRTPAADLFEQVLGPQIVDPAVQRPRRHERKGGTPECACALLPFVENSPYRPGRLRGLRLGGRRVPLSRVACSSVGHGDS